MTNERAIEHIRGIKSYLTSGNPMWNVDAIEEACGMAIEALSADAVEVVRCKGCMYYKEASFDVITNHDMVCAYAPLHHFYRESNDYCSKGERKEQK